MKNNEEKPLLDIEKVRISHLKTGTTIGTIIGEVPYKRPEFTPSPIKPTKPVRKPNFVLILLWSLSLTILGIGLQFSNMLITLSGGAIVAITTGILLILFRPYLVERSRNNFYAGVSSLLIALIGYITSSYFWGSTLAKMFLIVGVIVGFWFSPILVMIFSVVLIPFILMPRPVQHTDLTTESNSDQAKEIFVQKNNTDFFIQEQQHGAGDEDDIFQYRIIQPEEIERIISDIEQVLEKEFSPDYLKEFVGYLKQLLSLIAETITDPKKLAPILADVLIVTPTASFGFAISKHFLEILTHWAKTKKNPCGMVVAEKMELLQDYFQVTSKSRIAEISSYTGLSKDEAHALLRLGPFSHEKACFWRIVCQ
jgi:uncharacterized membrane protein